VPRSGAPRTAEPALEPALRKLAAPARRILQGGGLWRTRTARRGLVREMLMGLRRLDMLDSALVAVTVGFFALAIAYVWACERV